jgi:hypothetical protein
MNEAPTADECRKQAIWFRQLAADQDARAQAMEREAEQEYQRRFTEQFRPTDAQVIEATEPEVLP